MHWSLSGERQFLSRKEISIILPAYNEAARIEKCIQEVALTASSFSSSYEIIVAEDGSTDGTETIVANLSKSNIHLNLLHSPIRLGKGKAIKRAMRSASGNAIVFMDVDLATRLDHLQYIVGLAQERRGLIIGSRHVKGARVQRRISRSMFSLAYNLLVRVLFQDGVHDHQCGFKAINHEVAEVILNRCVSDGFFFDTEMILWCKKLGYSVKETGVEWAEKEKEGRSAVRLFPDSMKLGLDLLRFRLNGDP